MRLGLIKNEFKKTEIANHAGRKTVKQFELFKNMIKKDLEVVVWQNKVTRVFDEFQIYSDCRYELNSFDHIISFLTGSHFDFADESLESYVSYKCPEHFLNYLIIKDYKFGKNDLEALALKYTHYILEASEVLIKSDQNMIEDVKVLETKFFEGSDPTLMKYINPIYLN